MANCSDCLANVGIYSGNLFSQLPFTAAFLGRWRINFYRERLAHAHKQSYDVIAKKIKEVIIVPVLRDETRDNEIKKERSEAYDKIMKSFEGYIKRDEKLPEILDMTYNIKATDFGNLTEQLSIDKKNHYNLMRSVCFTAALLVVAVVFKFFALAAAAIVSIGYSFSLLSQSKTHSMILHCQGLENIQKFD